MGMTTRIALVASVVLLSAPTKVPADYWARYRPFTCDELSQAIAFCSIQPRVRRDVRVFVGTVHGRLVDNCMRAMGWVGVVR